MVFIFNDHPGMHAVAASTTGLADETGVGGTQCQVSGATVMPPGMDHVSAMNAAAAKAHAAAYAGHLATAAGHQHNYGGSISESATAYGQTDTVSATGVAEVGVNAAQVAAGLSATRL